ncbi:Cthe_2314 family HEPN domain-containing protein [Paenibacillus sp.]|uniref:Cthe_2314 family HEPN domain-containing protein n=1 Tax=Paenibacillus sp. TaxID=58172 RepID=UPI002810C314|nr:Cthe_2314 family HEPN domain-containing protein [Paenibacillus sp.]
MLRKMCDEPPRTDDAQMRDILALTNELAIKYGKLRGGEQAGRAQTLVAWMKSLASSFDELEQSVHCAIHFAERVQHDYMEEMGPEERTDFRRHLYFYKNAFIRVFSVLDKLGSFMNDIFGLHAERVKERYSYFTVLRCMREARAEPELLRRLDETRNKYREPVRDLRLMRNHEVHAINTELLDEDGRLRLRPRDPRTPIEDLRRNVAMLQAGYAMAGESLHAVLQYCDKRA